MVYCKKGRGIPSLRAGKGANSEVTSAVDRVQWKPPPARCLAKRNVVSNALLNAAEARGNCIKRTTCTLVF